MKNSFKKYFMFTVILLALTVSALGVTPAFADDGVTPPTDSPAVEVPVVNVPAVDAPIVEAPVAAEPVADVPTADAPIVEAPVVAEEPAVTEEPVAATEEEAATVTEALEQLPEGTDLVVVGSTGDALPLATQEAAQVLSSSDPFFWDGSQYVGFTTSTGSCTTAVTIAVCNKSSTDTPLKDAIGAFDASSGATGNIYVAAGTYSAGVTIDGSSAGNIKNLTGLIGAGSRTTILNGNLTVKNMNAFTFQGFTLNGAFFATNNNGTLNVTDVAQSTGGKTGIYVDGNTGNVNLTDVSASGNGGYGAFIGNVTGNVTVAGKSNFGNNSGNGISFYRITGNATINDAVIHDNGRIGVANQYVPSVSLTLNCVTFTNNSPNISGPATVNAGPCGSSGQAYVAFPTSKASSIIPSTPAAPSAPIVGGERDFTHAFEYPIITSVAFDKLPGALPNGKTFLAGFSIKRVHGSVKIGIPAGAKAPFNVLFWNGKAWVVVSSSVVDGQIVLLVNGPGIYVLAK